MARIKTFREILSSMVDWMVSNNSKLTNFFVGGVLRSLLEAVSLEIEALYYQMNKGFKKSLRESVYTSFNFPKLAAQSSSGVLKFTFKTALTAPLVIAAGYRVGTNPINGTIIYFETTQDNLVPIGATYTYVQVSCTQAGEIGNVPAGTVRVPLSRITQVGDITNDGPMVGGMEEETEESRKARFSLFINSLCKGTVESVQYGCIQVPGVTGASVDDQIGVVKVYVHNAAGDLPNTIRDAVQSSLINYRAAGVEVLVLPVSKRTVDLNINLSLREGFDPSVYTDLVKSEVTRYLNNYSVYSPLIVADLTRFIMSIDMLAIANISMSIKSDIQVLKSEIIRPGSIVVTAGS